ncbi:MAG: polyisoprenoid-binding protein [Nitrospinae bacterium]|nr:polyisoprenoid-binding protein [Nitrospinota bacterium]MBI3814459.1 polyisoprenoid-binding protein [Nitrospinota bacterium]
MIKKMTLFIMSIFFVLAQSASAEVYNIDADHSHIGLSVKHMVISNVKGKFNKFTGSFVLDKADNIEDASMKIEVASIDTNHEKRDEHLRSPDFLDAAKFPQITYQHKKVLSKEGSKYKVLGALTIRGVTKDIVLEGEMLGKVKDPWGYTRVGFTGGGKLDRRDFGLVWNKLLETGGLIVDNTVTIILEFEGIMQK